MRELIPVVFNKASQEQKRAIIAYAEMELTKKIETESVPKVTIASLFPLKCRFCSCISHTISVQLFSRTISLTCLPCTLYSHR